MSVMEELEKPDSSSLSSRIPQEILIQVFKNITDTQDLLHCTRVSKKWCECAIELWKKPCLFIYDAIDKMCCVLAAPQQTFAYARFIHHLDLSNYNFTKVEVLLQFRHCDNIEYLGVNECVPEELLMRVVAHLENLTTICLTNCFQITDNFLVYLAHTKAAKRLEDIRLGDCYTITDKGILALARGFPGLRRIDLVSISLITPSTITALVKSCPLLTKIKFSYCGLVVTDLAVRSLWQHSTQLQELRILDCPALTSNAFPTGALPGSTSRQLGAALLSSIDNLPESSPAYDGDALPPLILNHSFDQMRILSLTGGSLITDDAIEGIILCAPNIQDLNLLDCPRLTSRTVEAICELGESLRYLRLYSPNELNTDSTTRSLATSCTNLRMLEIGTCGQITLATISFLLQKLGELVHLKLVGFPPFQDTELQRAFGETFGPDLEDRRSGENRMKWADFLNSEITQLRDFLRTLQLQEEIAD